MKVKFLLVALIIFMISLFALYPSFNLALLGDDWLAFFRYFQHVGPKSPGAWNHLTYFLTPYGAQDIMMGLLQKLVGYESSWYYLTSYFLRMLAAFSLYPVTVYLTKSRLAALFAVLFFSVTVVGFDTTNWSSNMTTYITIALFNLFLYFFLKSREINYSKFFLFAVILYYLAYVTTPIRMHGSLPFIFLLEGFWIIQEKNTKTIKKSALRLALILGIFLIIRYTGHSQGPTEEVTQRFGLGIKAMSEMLSTGRFDFLFYPVVMFGSMFIPDFMLRFIQPVGNLTQLSLKLILPSLFGSLLLIFLIIKNIEVSTEKILKLVICLEIIWSVIVAITYKANLLTFSDSRLIFLSLIGGYILILGIILLFYFFKRRGISTALFLGLSWSMLSFFFAWWWVPTSIFPTTYRYLIVSAVGVSILLATIISLGKEKKHQVSLFAILSIILIIHIISTRIYINSLISSHGQEISKKIWSSIPRVPEIGKNKEPIIFYFEGDGTNGGILHDVVTFGFPPHMAILYNLREEDGGIPVPMDDFRQVISAATDGKSLYAYGYPIKRVPLERIYAFHLQGKENLIDVTNEARKKLLQIKSP